MHAATTQPFFFVPSSIKRYRALIDELPGQTYALIDACLEELVPDKMTELGENAACLYKGEPAQQFRHVAPYLARVDHALLDWIVKHIWEPPSWLLLVADTTFADLRKHFRKFVIAIAPSGEEMLFRFYDPRVLPVYLDACTGDEAARFFGPVKIFLCAGDGPGELEGIELVESPFIRVS